MTTVLVVEDELEIARVVRDYLQHAGFEYMWQLAWDRIPGHVSELTLSGLK